jgi:ribosomal protein L7/L12
MKNWVVRFFFKSILFFLGMAFAITRDKIAPQFPYDKKTKTVVLPAKMTKEVRHLVVTGRKIEAIKRVAQLTGAGLRISKDYVDSLV